MEFTLCYELYRRGYNIMDGLRRKDPKHDQIVELDIHLRFHALSVIVLPIVGLLGNCHWLGGGSVCLAALRFWRLWRLLAALSDGSLSDLSAQLSGSK